MITSTKYITSVIIHPYAHKHFIGSFAKKYKKQRDQTWIYIEDMLYHLDNYVHSTKVEMIHTSEYGQILKCEFKVAGSQESAKSSGNRMIVYHDFTSHICHVLLVYCKTHIKGSNETVWREQEVKKHCAVVR